MAENAIILGIKSPAGMRKKPQRSGRGPGSTLGKTAGKGHKGQKARTGKKLRRGFEGGQMPLYRRIPKRGFTNIFKSNYHIINLNDLEKKISSNDVLDLKKMMKIGLIKIGNSDKRKNSMIKILGTGEITKPITVYTHKISKSAGDKIIKAGGKVFILSSKVKLNNDFIELPESKLEIKEYKVKG